MMRTIAKKLPWPRPLTKILVEQMSGMVEREDTIEMRMTGDWFVILAGPGRGMLEKLSYARDDSPYIQRPDGKFNCQRNLLLRIIAFLVEKPTFPGRVYV